jgi:predicted nucleotide-binding protein (sugar kinase/HSP70/actin superfamily)
VRILRDMAMRIGLLKIKEKKRLINPVLNLRGEREKVFKELRNSFSESGFDFSKREIADAFFDGDVAYRRFKKSLRAEGKKVLEELGDKSRGIVIVGRPYTAYDKEMNLKLAGKIAHYGFVPIPMDFLPFSDEDLSEIWGNEFSIQGQMILNAANVSRKLGLNVVDITYFGCGPDSFLLGSCARELGKPFLTLQIDEHTADAGLVTRIEAFLDSIELKKEKK